ncbi:MAG: NAD-dependent epimerase/dehydratase family protein [Halorhabdus sp.]
MDISDSSVLVPGGNGFLGSWVVDHLRDRGARVVSASKRDDFDFRTYDDVDRILSNHQFDAVVNCAVDVGGIQYVNERPCDVYYHNIRMSSHLLEGARRHDVERFVNPIANCTYPAELTGEFSEDEWWNGPMHESVEPFAITRKSSWVQAKTYAEAGHFDVVNPILPNMYGPRDDFDEEASHALGALVMKFVEAGRNDRQTVTVWGTGTPVREWLYVEDAAEALVRSLSVPSTVEPINIGCGNGLSIMALAELIKDVVGYDGNIVLDESKPDGDPYRVLDVSRMRDHYDWEPPTSIRDGIAQTVAWYRENK